MRDTEIETGEMDLEVDNKRPTINYINFEKERINTSNTPNVNIDVDQQIEDYHKRMVNL